MARVYNLELGRILTSAVRRMLARLRASVLPHQPRFWPKLGTQECCIPVRDSSGVLESHFAANGYKYHRGNERVAYRGAGP